MTATLGDVFRLAERTARNSRLVMLDTMEELRSVTGRAWTATEKYRWLDAQSTNWRTSSYFVIPWAVMSWEALTPDTPDVTLILRLHSRVWSIEPMLVAAVPVRRRSGASDAGYYLEDSLRDGRATCRPVVQGDDRLVEVTVDHKKTHFSWRAFAVSLARLTSPEALRRAVVAPLACLVVGDPNGAFVAMSGEDAARVGFGAVGQTGEEDGDSVEHP